MKVIKSISRLVDESLNQNNFFLSKDLRFYIILSKFIMINLTFLIRFLVI